MVSKSQVVGGFGRRIFNKKEIVMEEANEENDGEEDVMKNIPDYERSTNKRLELQHFINDFNSLVLKEKSTSKSKELSRSFYSMFTVHSISGVNWKISLI